MNLRQVWARCAELPDFLAYNAPWDKRSTLFLQYRKKQKVSCSKYQRSSRYGAEPALSLLPVGLVTSALPGKQQESRLPYFLTYNAHFNSQQLDFGTKVCVTCEKIQYTVGDKRDTDPQKPTRSFGSQFSSDEKEAGQVQTREQSPLCRPCTSPPGTAAKPRSRALLGLAVTCSQAKPWAEAGRLLIQHQEG